MKTESALPKNAGPVQVLNETGAGTFVSYPQNKKVSQPKFDHFPELCDNCRGPLRHEDLIGKYHGVLFLVKGYSCPSCGHNVGKVYRKNFKDSTVPFDWKRIDVPCMGRNTARAV